MSDSIETISRKFKDTEMSRTVRLICCGMPFDFDTLKLKSMFPHNIIKSMADNNPSIQKDADGASILRLNTDIQSMRIIYTYYNTMQLIIPQSQIEQELLLATCDFFGFVEISKQVEAILVPEQSDFTVTIIEDEPEPESYVEDLTIDSTESADYIIPKCIKNQTITAIDNKVPSFTINPKCNLSAFDKQILLTETALRKEYYKGEKPAITRVKFIDADKEFIDLNHPYTLINSPKHMDYEWISTNKEFMENMKLYSFGIIDEELPTTLVVAGSAAFKCALKINISDTIIGYAKELAMYITHTADIKDYYAFSQIQTVCNPMFECSTEKLEFLAKMIMCHKKLLYVHLLNLFRSWRTQQKPTNLINYLKTPAKKEVRISNDIDLFITTEDPDIIIKSIRYIHEKMSKFGYVHILRTKHAVSFHVDKTIIPSVQIILRAYDSLEHILLGFDIDSCCIGFDHELICSARFLRSIKYGYNLVDLSRLSTTYEARLMKYYTRGFDIAMTDPSIKAQTEKILAIANKHRGLVSFSIFQGIYKLAYLLIQYHRLTKLPKVKIGYQSDYSCTNIAMVMHTLYNGIEKTDFVYGNDLDKVLFDGISESPPHLQHWSYRSLRSAISKATTLPSVRIMRRNVTKQGDSEEELFTGSFNPIQMRWYDGEIIF